MLYYPYVSSYNPTGMYSSESFVQAPQPNTSYLRLMHASPDAPAVDVYANDKMIAKNLRYRQFTEYMPILPGKYKISVYVAGTRTNPVINTDFDVLARSILTVAAIGKAASLSLLPVSDPIMPRVPGKAMVRFANLSPDAPNVDLTLPNGYRLFENIAYKGVANYIPLHPATYTFETRVAGTDQVILYVPNMVLRPNTFYTIYMVGMAEGRPGLQLLIPMDGNTYIRV